MSKARDWFEKMEVTFKSMKLDSVSQEDLAYMKNLTDYYIAYDYVMERQLGLR